MAEPRHILVVANETVAGKSLIDALRSRADEGPIRVTVISPQNEPRAGFVVYADSRRSSADRRLRRTLDLLHEAGIAARGAVVDPDPLQAIKDAIYEYDPDEIIISTHPGELKSSWLRANLIERARKVTDKPVEHVVVDLESPRERAHVLVLANQTVLGAAAARRDPRAERGQPRRVHAPDPRRRGRAPSGGSRASAGSWPTRASRRRAVSAIPTRSSRWRTPSTTSRSTRSSSRRSRTRPRAGFAGTSLGRIKSFGLPVTHVVVTQQEAEAAEESAVA